MVRIKRKTGDVGFLSGTGTTVFVAVSFCLAVGGWLLGSITSSSTPVRMPLPDNSQSSSHRANVRAAKDPLLEEDFPNHHDANSPSKSTDRTPQCYASIQQLSPAERFPVEGPRHIVDPPKGGPLTLVCCETTKGPWSIAVHSRWAPLGAERFLNMVRSGYFSNKVPLMRCIKGFLCQFGLAGPPSKEFDERLPDDPQWLPKGPEFRRNDAGVHRFAHGYFSYAGAGPNSRGVQLFVALAANGGLGGGSPWEVPWGELVGDHSYATLARISTAYGEKGPSQPRLRREGASEAVAKDFPLLDYVLSCRVVDELVDPIASS
jgi:peptidyl-prolyl cis-trans isomerase A (cyclophilin A)